LFSLLLVAVCVPLLYARRSSLKAQNEKEVHLLGLTTAAAERFFSPMHASQNRRLFRAH
jgi:hypothetical protein